MRKIYIDGLGLVDGHFSGVGQYILGILQGMDELIDERRAVSMPTPIVSVVTVSYTHLTLPTSDLV